MRQTLDIHDYYFGVIVATPEYLQSPKRVRMLQGVNYDPFSEISDEATLIFGVTTLLKKETRDGQCYYIDQYNSRYKNELVYQLHQPDKFGIYLAYVKPFTECYEEEPTWYLEEEITKGDLLFQIQEKHTYYISYSRLQNSEAIFTLNSYEDFECDPVRQEYLKQLLGEEMYSRMTERNKEFVKDMDIQ